MDEKYQEYFSKQIVDKWSLMDYDNWLIKNFDHNQPVKSHRKFYSILTDILVDSKNANLLLKNPKILKIIHEAPEKWKKEEKKRKHKKKKNDDLDDKERALSLKERELDLKEREISLREREVKLRNEL
ncbi:hypothetical protein C1646_677865 [Rhizophagus diaphanus]|nr:hypothetical protein C1646_677865 [Rhizophagus diaphanus] [Rhizophagus sp. MUCL 43196]